jgi:tripartite-type tricarboxylate transporter receptor subunit TctC
MKTSIWGAAMMAGFFCLPLAAAQDNFPVRPIRLVSPFAPGGGNDIVSRTVALALSKEIGQPVIVDNRPGATSIIGMDLVAKAEPDGYTLITMSDTFPINATLYPKLPYDSLKDFAPVSLVAITTNTLVVNPSVPVRSVKELIALAKAKPGSLNYASTGAGGTSYLAMEYFRLETGTNLVHIPYKGTPLGLTDVAGGRVQVMFSALPGTMAFLTSKRIVALATTGTKRSVFVPELPTLDEAGVPGYEFDTWYGIHSPAKVPRQIIARLNREIGNALSRPEVKEQFFKQGLEVRASSSGEYAQFVYSEVAKMARIIKASGARPEQ